MPDIQLVNDEASPGNNKVYGTDGTGTKGWKSDPASATWGSISGTLSDQTDLQAALASVQENLWFNSAFNINQREVSGTVTLSAGEYGHDRLKAGSGGCTYTFASSGGVTTITITSGTLIQVIDGRNIETATHALAWYGTAQARIGGGSYGDSGMTAAVTGGANLEIEFGTGTLTGVAFSKGSVATPMVRRPLGIELPLCMRYFYRLGFPPWSGVAGTTGVSRMGGPHPVARMNGTPSVTLTGAMPIYDGATTTTFNTIDSSYSTENYVQLDVGGASGLTTGRLALIYDSGDTGIHVDVDAEI